MTKRTQDFILLVKKVFKREYSFEFNESVSIDGIRYDLWDPLKGAFVEIIEHANKNKRSTILDRALKTIRNLNKAESEINYYFLVFNDKITKSDKEYYIKNFIQTKLPIEIFDREDILMLSNKNVKNKIQGKTDIKFSTEAEIKDKTPQATSPEISVTDETSPTIEVGEAPGVPNPPTIELTEVEFEPTSENILSSKKVKDKIPPATGTITNVQTSETKIDSDKKLIDIKDFMTELGDINYFLAGSVWGNEDQIGRFVSNSIWENGNKKNDTSVVNSVEDGDIIFLKSTFAKNKISYLRIKAIGVVFGNFKDGHNLKVNWHLRGPIDIEGLGKYRRTFTKIKPDDITVILDNVLKGAPNIFETINLLKKVALKLDKQKKGRTESNESGKKTTSTTIAGLISDADSGTDYLEIDKDVNAFAKVISAKSFKPPLAIALLGKWGSGKSFFMRKLKEQVENLSEGNNQHIYCNGIAHVKFNAWSYMDSNLWAGIITKIFEGLQQYISNDTLASEDKIAIEKTLTKKLNIANDEIKELENQKESIDSKIKGLESQRGTAKDALDEKIKEIKDKSIKKVLNELDNSFKIKEKVTRALESNNSFGKSEEKFSKIIPRQYWQNPIELYRKVKSTYTYVKTFFKGAKWQDNLAWFAFILILVIFLKCVVFLVAYITGRTDFTIPTNAWYIISITGGFIYRNYQTFRRLQPIISSFFKIKEDYELQKKDAIFKVNQEEKALKFEIENYKATITFKNEQINEANEIKSEIEYRLENTLTTEALFNFIERRSVSDDYKKHLGIVSVIRKDFEILSELFSGHNDEINKSEESEEFKKRFDKPLERIILYIDDLDRCSDDRVVQVLEAVNLLMAYPLFVVVVGVDPRWVKNALIKKHHRQFNKNGREIDDLEMIAPSNYLEKIFQVPFQLKAATDSNVKHMLKILAESNPVIDNSNVEFDFTEEGELANHFDENEDENNLDETFEESNTNDITITSQIVESLKFSKKEIELLQSMSDILGNNPRALKRFVNIYRVIKAHEDFNYTDETAEGELLAVMFLIALPLGKYKKLAKPFDNYIKISIDDNYDLSAFKTVGNDVYVIEKATNPSSKKYPLEDLKTELINMLRLKNATLLNQNKKMFRKHHDFIKRFTFNIV